MTPNTAHLAVAARSATAVIGGYLFSYAAAIWLSHILPMARVEAVMSGLLASFCFYAGAIIWAFGARTVTRAVVGIALSTAIVGFLAWSAAPSPGP